MAETIISLIIGMLLGVILGLYLGRAQRKKPYPVAKPISEVKLQPNGKLTSAPEKTAPQTTQKEDFTGVIRLMKNDKGFGFITYDGNNEIFFHIKNWKNTTKSPRPGMKVIFNIHEDDQKKGKFAAVNLRLVE